MGPSACIEFSAHPAPDYLLGRDAEGRWIARDVRGLAGDLFASRDAALGSRATRPTTGRTPCGSSPIRRGSA